MFHNYFFLKRLAEELHQQLVGLSLLECFSQNKDELILGFASQEKELYIRANLDPNISMLSFPDQFHRAGKNSVDLFPQLINQKVKGVQVFSYERSFEIQFEKDSLIFKLHVRRANLLLYSQGHVVDVFRKSLAADYELTKDDLNQNIELSESYFKESNEDPLHLMPALGKEIKAYLDTSGFYNRSDRWRAFNELLHQLEQNPIYLHGSGHVSLIIPSEKQEQSALAATNWLYNEIARTFYFEKEKKKAVQRLKQQIKKSENYISKTNAKLQQVKNERSPEEIANILMANLNSLQTGLSRAVLHDFYRNEPIEIKLNRELSPQKNAENLYRKSKNRHQEIDVLHKNIASKKTLIEKLSRQVLHIDELKDTKSLRNYLKGIGLDERTKTTEIPLPYHEFMVDGWQILLGKHAKANDELTLKVANKNDLWLHAKDVSGSHVVVRQKPGHNFPTHIIESAAALAAAHSKRKTDSLCPVIYTPKKYVRKVKGAPPGQVIVEKEDVIMVEPSTLS